MSNPTSPSNCPECGGRLGVAALRCRCGWSAAGAAAISHTPALQRPSIQCCFEGCPNPANVRLFTKTGWVNVCARVDPNDKTSVYHYEKIERAARRSDNPRSEELREAWRKSPAFLNR